MERNNKHIFVVSSFGGGIGGWELNECAFYDREDAESYIQSKKDMLLKIPFDEYTHIKDLIYETEDNLYYQYYDEDNNLLEGKTDAEYDAQNDEWLTSGKAKFLKDNFNVDVDVFNFIDAWYSDNGCDFNIEQIEIK